MKSGAEAVRSDIMCSALWNTALTGYVLIDAESMRIVDLNDAAKKMLGPSADANYLGKKCFDSLCSFSKEDCPASNLSGPMMDETRFIKANGKALYVQRQLELISLCDSDYILESFTEIEPCSLAQKEQQQRLEFLEELIDIVPTPLFYKNSQGEYIDCNKAFCDYFNKAKKDIIGQTVHSVAPAEFAEAIFYTDMELINRGGKERYETQIQKLNGEQRDVVLDKIVFHGADDNPAGLIGMITDVTDFKKDSEDRVRLERELSHAQKLESVGTLAAGIAHEINTPIQFIGDNTRFVMDAVSSLLSAMKHIREGLDSDVYTSLSEFKEVEKAVLNECDPEFLEAELPDALSQTLEGVSRVSEIVKAMKDFTHMGEEMSEQDINEVIRTTVTLSRNEWKYWSKIETSLDPGLPAPVCCGGDIKQVVLNLIVNAAHAIADTGKQGTIDISTRFCGGSILIKVADTGKGITAEIGRKIFDPFFTTKPVGKGTGQGLAIVYKLIVEKYGGRVWYESDGRSGTAFYIKLPLKPRKQK